MIYVSNEYLIHHNPNHDEEGKFTFSKGGSAIKGAASSVGSALLRKKKNKLPDADILSKKGGSKSNDKKLSKEERARLVNSGSLEDINANKDRMSNKELEFAIDRIQKDRNDRNNLEKRLSELNGPEEQSKIEKGAAVVEKAVKSGMTMKDLTAKGMQVWNVMADIHNLKAPSNDKWFTFDKDGKPVSNSEPRDIINLIQTGSISDILKNKDYLTKEQLQEAIDRRNKISELEKMNPETPKKDSFFKKATTEISDKEKSDIIERGDYDSYSKNTDKFTPSEVKKMLDNYQLKKSNEETIKNIKYDNKMKTNEPSMNPPSEMISKEKKGGLFGFGKKKENQTPDMSGSQVAVNPKPYVEGTPVNSNPQVNTNRSYEVHSKPIYDYQPSDAVKDFIGIYYGKEAPETKRAEAIIDAAVVGTRLYKQRHKRTY